MIFNPDPNFYTRLVAAIFCVLCVCFGFNVYYTETKPKNKVGILILTFGLSVLCLYFIGVHC
mgnify:CR=1 FL=1